MQLGEAQKGFPCRSKLFDSLKMYLDNKNRLQPIIGLGSIIECVNAGTNGGEALYVCDVCVCRLTRGDMRNHIIGSLHRYNYIKAWHPYLLSGWKETSELSKLAWPLMDMAKILEGKEGPGDIQLLQVENDVYQKMTTHSESDAISLINSLRYGQGHGEPEDLPETTAVQLDHCPTQSHRIELLPQNQCTQSEKSFTADIMSHKISAQTNRTPVLQSSVAPPTKSGGWLKNILTSEFDCSQMSPEQSVLSGNSSSFLGGYTGTKPLIGLFCVVECQSEDGRTYCFLCNCCRIRSNKKDIIDHLTSSSHLRNYLMETHPEQMNVMTVTGNDSCQFLQSLAKKVEQDEGRGELMVVNAPESLCILLTSKSYNWCINMLETGWADTDNRQKKAAVKGTSSNTTSAQGMPEKCAVVCSKSARKKTRKGKKSKVTNTVFKVSLPLTKGAVLLERTSFSKTNRFVSGAYPPSSSTDHISLPKSHTEDFKLDCDTGSFAVYETEHTTVYTPSPLEQSLCSEYTGADQYMRPEINFTATSYQEVGGYFGHNVYFNQSEDMLGIREQNVSGELNYNRQHGFQERSSNGFSEDLKNKGPQTQRGGVSPLVSHTHDWSSYNSSYGCEDSYAFNMYAYFGHPLAHSTSAAPESKTQFHETQHGHIPTVPRSYETQPMAYQAMQVGYGIMCGPNYNIGPRTNNYQHFPHPASGGSGGDTFYSDAHILPSKAP